MSTCTLVDHFSSKHPVIYQASLGELRLIKNNEVFADNALVKPIMFDVIGSTNTSANTNVTAYNDRALNYGDGVFTTMYAELNQHELSIYALKQHMERLAHNSRCLYMPVDPDTLESIFREAIKTFLKAPSNTANKPSELDVNQTLVVKILLSRGVGGRAYQAPDNPKPNIIISLTGYTKTLSDELQSAQTYSVGISNIKLAQQSILAGVKHLNRLEQVLAKEQMRHTRFDDVLLCDTNDQVIEASAANVFFYKNNQWFTPKIETCGVKGVMRNLIIDYFTSHKIGCEEASLTIKDLQNIQSMFICNALNAIHPVSHLTIGMTNLHFDNSALQGLKQNFVNWLSRFTHTISRSS